MPLSSDIPVQQEELEIPYTIEYHERDANMLAPKEMRNIHPLGKAPILQDGDKIIAESGTIIGSLFAP
jgi:glutathione S-transferase